MTVYKLTNIPSFVILTKLMMMSFDYFNFYPRFSSTKESLTRLVEVTSSELLNISYLFRHLNIYGKVKEAEKALPIILSVGAVNTKKQKMPFIFRSLLKHPSTQILYSY